MAQERKSIFGEHLRRHALSYGFGFALLFVSCYLQLYIPELIGRFTDRLEHSLLTREEAWRYGIGILTVGAGVAFFRSISRIYLFRLARRLEMRLRNELFAHWETMSARFYDERRVGDLMAYSISDVGVIRETTMGALFNAMEAVVLIVIAVVTLSATVDPWLTLWTMLPLPLLSLLAYRFQRRMQAQSNDIQDAIARMTSRVQEFVAGVRVVKAFAREESERERFGADNRAAAETNLALVRTQSSFSALGSIVVGASVFVSVVVGGWMTLRGMLSLGDFAALNTTLSLLVGPVENLGKVVHQIQRGVASQRRLLELFRTPPDIADDERTDMSVVDIEGDIEIRNLTFCYPGQARPALRDVSLRVPKGATLGVVGRVGAGKTTLVHLLVRLYDPPEGTIFLDGRDIRTIPLAVLRDRIGVVTQETFLFSSTVRDNIAFNPHPTTEDQVKEAAEIADVYKDVRTFSDGFDTEVGERGISLSGGQRQRLGIARAVIKRPSVYLLDDCLSAVDAVTEERILHRLRAATRGRTTVIVAHRVSAVRHADLIAVLEDGRIVETGTHESLLRLNGRYAEMVRMQAPDAEGTLVEEGVSG